MPPALRATSRGFDIGQAIPRDRKSMLRNTTDVVLFEISRPAMRASALVSRFPRLLRGKKSRKSRSGNKKGDRRASASAPLAPLEKISSALQIDRKADLLHRRPFNKFEICVHEINGG